MTIDMSPTSVGRFVIASAAATGWLMTSSVTQDTSEVRAPQPSSVARPTVSMSIPDTGFTEKLRERLKPPPPPSDSRNPFAYGARHAASAPRPDVPAEIAPAPPPVETEPPLPVFKLSGIAASQVDGMTVLTAIIIDNGSMVFAKAGDKLSNGHTVVRVEDMSVTLVDAAGVTQTLRLP